MSRANSPEPSTVELLESYYGGDRAALGELLDRHRQWLWNYVRKHMGAHLRLLETSEDLVQDTFRALIECGPAFVPRDDSQFRRLAATIVLNRLRDRNDYARAERRDAGREVPLEPSAISHIGLASDSTSTPSRVAARREDEGLLHLALELLDASDAHLLRRHRWDGIGLAELAASLGITTAAAQKRHIRAVARLGRRLRQLESGDLAELGPDPLEE